MLEKFSSISVKFSKIWRNFDEKFETGERCKGAHRVDLGESFPTNIWLQKSASIQTRTSLVKFARSPCTDPPGDASAGDTMLEVLSTVGFAVEDMIQVNPGSATQESSEISAITASGLLLRHPLLYNHIAGEDLVKVCVSILESKSSYFYFDNLIWKRGKISKYRQISKSR